MDLESKEILALELPRILTRQQYQTASSAYHRISYKGELEKWDLLEPVKEAITKYCNNTEPLCSQTHAVSDNQCSVDREHYLCGDEQSVCGRFAQNALSPTTAVAFANSIQIRFGDYKVSAEAKVEKGLIPDFVGVNCPAFDLEQLNTLTHPPHMRLVGEAKTPWSHSLPKVYEAFTNGIQVPLRLALGQIAKYMHQFKMKFAFLTTYDHTIFLKQEIPPGGSKFSLYVSPPIPADASPRGESVVSVRQCLYYVICAAGILGDYTADNPIPLKDWVDDASGKAPKNTTSDIPEPRLPRTPRELIELLSPMIGRQFSDTDYIELHRTSSTGMLTACLSFHPDQLFSVQGRTYIKIKDQEIQVHVKNYEADEANPVPGDDIFSRPTHPAPLVSQPPSGETSLPHGPAEASDNRQDEGDSSKGKRKLKGASGSDVEKGSASRSGRGKRRRRKQ